MLFNKTLDKIIRQWMITNDEMEISKTYVWDKKDDRAKVDCLDFPLCDMATISEIGDAKKQST